MATRSNTAVDLRLMRQFHFNYLIDHGIQTDEELLEFIEGYFGYRLVNRKVCPHHDAPSRFVTDQFFDRIRSCFGFGPRAGGKTISVGILNSVEMLFHPGVDICSAGAEKKQAERGRKYVDECLGKVADLFEGPGARIGLAKYQPEEIILTNDSRIECITASYGGFNGPHVARFRADEIELIFWDLLQEAASITQSKNGIAAQDTFTSTRKIASGTVQKLLDQAEERNITVVSWCIFETLETCERKCHGDPVYGDCPAYSRKDVDGNEYLLCGGRAHEIPPGGWYKIADFIQKTANLDRDTYEAQWLCLRPNQQQIVYGACYRDEAPFVTTQEEESALLARYRESSDSWTRIYGQDFGANWALVELIQDPVDECWYAVWEYFWSSERDRSVATHAAHLKANDPLGFSEDDFFGYGDPAGRQVMTDLEEHGIHFEMALNDLYSGTHYVKLLFETRKLRIFRGCTELRRELKQTYIHPTDRRTGEVLRDKFFKKDNHCCFVAGTMVATSDGDQPIEAIRVGTQVLTRGGYRPVVAAAETNPSARVWTIELSNGQTLTGTPDHPIWTVDRGKVALRDLTPSDTLLGVCNVAASALPLKTSTSMASGSAGTPTRKTAPRACTSRRRIGRSVKAWGISTWRSGRRNTVLYLRVITSIIATTIRSITTKTIWRLFPALSISARTPVSACGMPDGWSSSGVASTRSGHWLRNGIDPKPDANGIGAMLDGWRTLKRNARRSVSRASSAVASTMHLLQPLGDNASVPTRASRHGVAQRNSTQSSSPARSAGVSATGIGTPTTRHAPIRAVRVFDGSVSAPVFNLTVEGPHEYFANGVLVANCDGLRYGLYSHHALGTASYGEATLEYDGTEA